jgi:hypothetical protein
MDSVSLQEVSKKLGDLTMRTRVAVTIVILAVIAGLPGISQIRGNYLEARNAEVYASHCFANSEVGIRGNLAVMAWHVEQGSADGILLDGLSVVAVIRAASTLGDPFSNPYPVKSVLIVDERAGPMQREALMLMAQNNARGLLTDVVRTEALPIQLSFDGSVHDRRATLVAGKTVRVETRQILDSDSLCHLDDLYYAPLSILDHAMPAFTIHNSFEGAGLNVHFSAPRRSSAYVGTFSIGRTHTD